MDRQTALRKIRACLSRATSDSTNEAAAALRQARKLMDEFGLTEGDVRASEVNSADAKTRSRGGVPPTSIIVLSNIIAAGFRCRTVLEADSFAGRTVFTFFGVGADAEVAAYAFEVLRRQLERDKARQVRRVRKAVVKASRAEAFARGWVGAVYNLFPKAILPEGREQQLDAAIANAGPTETTTGRKLAGRGARFADRLAGHIAGRRAQLLDGIQQDAQPLLMSDTQGSRP